MGHSSPDGRSGHGLAVIQGIDHPELHPGTGLGLDDRLELPPVGLHALGLGEDEHHGAGIALAEQFVGEPW
jgi:hypothetical protein